MISHRRRPTIDGCGDNKDDGGGGGLGGGGEGDDDDGDNDGGDAISVKERVLAFVSRRLPAGYEWPRAANGVTAHTSSYDVADACVEQRHHPP